MNRRQTASAQWHAERDIFSAMRKKRMHLLNGSALVVQKRMIAKACHQEEGL